MKVEWSDDALADLDRFASFLQQQHPFLAKLVASELMDKVQLLSDHPQLGRAVEGRTEYRQFVDGERLVVLRVLHGRERR